MIDIYCKDKKCPICQSEMSEQLGLMIATYCENRCYVFQNMIFTFKSNIYCFYIFDKHVGDFEEDDIKEIEEVLKNEISEEVEFWKENDRYVMKILEGKE